MIDRRRTRFRAYIEQDTDIGLEDGAEGIEEPTMGVDLLLVFFFETKDDLDGDYTTRGIFDFHRRCYGYLGGIFVDVCCDWFIVNLVL